MTAHLFDTDAPPPVLTVGHSTRTAEELVGLLEAHGAETVVDVRKMPGSRRNPQFDGEALSARLGEAGIGYVHLPELGGLRKSRPDSPNAAWRNMSFRGYADYMATPEFREGLEEMVRLSRDSGGGRPCLMCAEAVPWRCHRRLVADALLARGLSTGHVLGQSRLQPHTPTPWASIDYETGSVTYPPE